MTDSTPHQPKFKFKKRNINKKQKQLRKSHDDEDGASAAADSQSKPYNNNTPLNNDDANNSNNDEEGGALDTILAVERRRKLFNNRNRGVDSTKLLKASVKLIDDDSTNTATDTAKNKDLEERLKGTFSEGKLAGSNDMGGDEEGGILAKKHKRAMEEFIQQNLQGKTENSLQATATASGTAPNDDEKEMFAELLLSSADAATTNVGSQAKDEDVGAGGAMMMGSGIAEVALPASERLKTLKETEKVAAEYKQARQSGNDDVAARNDAVEENLHHALPMSFISGPGKRKRQDTEMVRSTVAALPTATSPKNTVTSHEQSTIITSSAAYSASSAGTSVQRSDVSTLGQSYSHNFQLHQQDWIAQRRDERQSEIDTLKTQQQVDQAEDEAGGRMGFAMARRVAKGEKSVRPPPARGPNGESLTNEWDRKKGGHQRSNDDRVWRQFMAKTKR